MTEDLTYCVRGCSRPCRCDEYLATGTCDHELRIRADTGYLCGRCSEKVLQAVDEIPDLWANMPGLYDIGRGTGEKIHRSKVSGSPALIRLDVMVLAADAMDRRGATPAYEGDGVMPVRPTIAGWIQLIDEELGLRPAGDTLTAAVALLHTWHRQIVGCPWVDEYARDMLAIRRALRRATGAPGPIGRCWGRIKNRPDGGCGRLLYAPIDGGDVVCPNERCGRRYSGAEAIKLAIQAEREAI